MKVGKEQIAGLLVALEEFVARDDTADQVRWRGALETLTAKARRIPGLECRVLRPDETPRPYPFLRIDVDPTVYGHSATEIVNHLQDESPRVCLAQWFIDEGALAKVPTQLSPGDELVIAERLKAFSRRTRGD